MFDWMVVFSHMLYVLMIVMSSKKISISAFAFTLVQVVNEPRDVHYPMVEMPTRSKLSCLSWNKYTKHLIASSDYEGIVTVWDVTTSQVVSLIHAYAS